MSDEEFTPTNEGVIDFKNGSRIYVNTDESEWKHVEGKSLMLDESNPIMIGKAWVCKVCKLDNMGVICSECKKMYNPADPDCELKD